MFHPQLEPNIHYIYAKIIKCSELETRERDYLRKSQIRIGSNPNPDYPYSKGKFSKQI